MLPTVVFAQGNNSGTTFEVGDSVELKEAFKKIENTEGTYTISLKEDITVEGESYSVSLKKGREVTLLGNGHTIYFKNKYGSLQTNGGTLNLGNESANKLTLDATGINRREAVIEIFGGTVNMYDHVTIKGNDNAQKSTMGGGVNVESASFAEYGDSTFNMYGGGLREKANEPSAPEKEGYVFGGWYTDSNYSDESEYDFSAPVTRHITLYAKWLKKMEPLNAVPAIMTEDKTLTVGDTFDPLKDVTASDTEDGDLTAKIEVLRSNVDTSKAGTYQVTYKVMDSMGASATNMTTWLALMFVSLGLLAGIFTVRKLRKSR